MTRTTKVALLVTMVLGLGTMLLWPRVMLNPGPLNPSHHGQNDDCSSCHSAFAGAPEEKCLACHPLRWIGVLSSTGARLPVPSLRSNLIHNVQPGTCMTCHFEHRLNGRPRLARIFPHEKVPAALLANCGACHAAQQPRDKIHVFAPTTCTPCHNLTRWDWASWDHSLFRLDKDHLVACAICHTVGTGFVSYTCYGCHTHTPPGMVATHLEVRITDLRNCARCHRWF